MSNDHVCKKQPDEYMCELCCEHEIHEANEIVFEDEE